MIQFDFELLNDKLELEDIKEKPEDGCYISGMQIEGCRYDLQAGILKDSNPRELQTKLPILWLKPTKNLKKDMSKFYMCPLQKTLARYGTLSTTGHSTNFVMMVDIKTDVDEEKWIKAGVAAFLSLKFD